MTASANPGALPRRSGLFLFPAAALAATAPTATPPASFPNIHSARSKLTPLVSALTSILAQKALRFSTDTVPSYETISGVHSPHFPLQDEHPGPCPQLTRHATRKTAPNTSRTF